MPEVFVDPSQIVEVLVILLENALDATRDPRRVRVVAGESGEGESPGRVTLDVVDQGPGILPERLDQIFDPFFSTKPQGAGLGLPIALRIAHENGAQIQVSSTPGKGSTFRLLLPTAETRVR